MAKAKKAKTPKQPREKKARAPKNTPDSVLIVRLAPDEIDEFKGYKETLAKTLPQGTRVSWSALVKQALRQAAA